MLALQLRFLFSSESMSHHDSGDHGWLAHRLRRRWSCGRRRCGSCVRCQPRTSCAIDRAVPRWPSGKRAAQDGVDARGSGWLGPWRQQAILGRGRWDADALRDIVSEYALETFADEDAFSWHGWHRHVSLVMLAFAMMAAIRHKAMPYRSKKRHHLLRKNVGPDPLVNQENRRIASKLAQRRIQPAPIIALSLWRHSARN